MDIKKELPDYKRESEKVKGIFEQAEFHRSGGPLSYNTKLIEGLQNEK